MNADRHRCNDQQFITLHLGPLARTVIGSALVAAGGRPHGYQQTGWGALTDTERKIANRLVLGRANAEIAEALFITTSTVEDHIGRIYAKLGIQRRQQLLASIIRLASTSS
ncbi:MAG TPA: helix-turn-helix transcriptional regulator [Actinomycetota bacterium]